MADVDFIAKIALIDDHTGERCTEFKEVRLSLVRDRWVQRTPVKFDPRDFIWLERFGTMTLAGMALNGVIVPDSGTYLVSRAILARGDDLLATFQLQQPAHLCVGDTLKVNGVTCQYDRMV